MKKKLKVKKTNENGIEEISNIEVTVKEVSAEEISPEVVSPEVPLVADELPMVENVELTPRALVEGVLFGSGQPISADQLADIIELPLEDTKNILGELQEEYAGSQRGFWLVRVAGGYQLRTKPYLKEAMAKFFEKKPPRLTQPMLEVLSIVAYKQPTTRPLIDKIRGVDSTAPLKALLDRSLVEMRGRSEAVGQPVLYGTTQKFLEWFQIDSLAALPPLSEIEILRAANPSPEGDELLNMLQRDDGFVSEDLRELDTTLLDVARQQRKFEEDVAEPTATVESGSTEAPTNASNTQADAGISHSELAGSSQA